MATKGILQLNNNDNLETVIKKCNTNFKSVLTQQSQQETQARQQQDEFEVDVQELVEDTVTEAVGQAVTSINERIDTEAQTRSQGDLDLGGAIEALDLSLSAVARSGSYEDLTAKPTDPVGSAYLTFDPVSDPNTLYGGTWFLAGTLAIGVETLFAWKRSA